MSQEKKPLTDLISQLVIAYNKDLIQGYSYDHETNDILIAFYPRNNTPIQTLIEHIEATYPVLYVLKKQKYTKIEVLIKIGKYTIPPANKSISRHRA